MMQARILQMNADVRRVLRAASLFGAVFWQGGVLQLLGPGVAQEEVAHIYQKLFSEEVIERHRTTRYPSEVQYGFRHALLRDAAYGLLTEEDRRVGHQLAARYLEKVGEPDPLVLLLHYEAAGDTVRALPYHISAGNRARQLCLLAQAQEHYNEALATLGTLPDTIDAKRQRIDLMIKLADTLIVADRSANIHALLSEAETTLAALTAEVGAAEEDQRRKTWLDYMFGRMHYFRGNPAQAIRYHRQVLSAASPLGSHELVAYPAALVGTALLCQGLAAPAELLLVGALPALEQLGDVYEYVRARLMYGWSQILQGRGDEGLSWMHGALERSGGNPRLLSLVHVTIAGALVSRADWPEVIRHAQQAMGYFSVIGDPGHRFLALTVLLMAYAERGELESARAHFELALTLGHELTGRLVMHDIALSQLAVVACALGETAEALQLCERVLSMADVFGTRLSAGVAEAVLGRLAAERADCPLSEVDHHFERSIAAFAEGEMVTYIAQSEIQWAFARLRRGSVAQARIVYDAGLRRLERYGCEVALRDAVLRWPEEVATRQAS